MTSRDMPDILAEQPIRYTLCRGRSDIAAMIEDANSGMQHVAINVGLLDRRSAPLVQKLTSLRFLELTLTCGHLRGGEWVQPTSFVMLIPPKGVERFRVQAVAPGS